MGLVHCIQPGCVFTTYTTNETSAESRKVFPNNFVSSSVPFPFIPEAEL